MLWKTISAFLLCFVLGFATFACIPELPEEDLSDCLETCEPKTRECFAEIAACHFACATAYTCNDVCEEWDEPRCVALCTDQRSTCDSQCELMSGVCLSVVVNCAEACIAEYEDALKEDL